MTLNKMKLNKLLLLSLLPLAFAACDSQQPASSANSAQPAQNTPAAAPAAPAPAEVVAPAPASDQQIPAGAAKLPPDRAAMAPVPQEVIDPVDAIGVGSCDDFVQRFRTCMNSGKIRGGHKFGMSRVFRQEVQQWQADAKAGKTSEVAAACTEADTKAREQLSKLGCTSF